MPGPVPPRCHSEPGVKPGEEPAFFGSRYQRSRFRRRSRFSASEREGLPEKSPRVLSTYSSDTGSKTIRDPSCVTAGCPILRALCEGWDSTNADAIRVLLVGADCTRMVYTGAVMAMAKSSRAKSARTKHVRRSVTLPPKIAKQVEILAKERALSDNRVLVELIEQGIEARQQKEKAFFQLAERFRAADDAEQVKQLGNQLGRFVFGE
jgi:hypothetical protein